MAMADARGGGQRPGEILAGLTNRAGEVTALGERGRDGRREGAAGPVRAGRRQPPGRVLVDTLRIDEHVDHRIVFAVAAFDHHSMRSEFHDAPGGDHPVLAISAGSISWTARTPRVFCAVTAVMTVNP